MSKEMAQRWAYGKVLVDVVQIRRPVHPTLWLVVLQTHVIDIQTLRFSVDPNALVNSLPSECAGKMDLLVILARDDRHHHLLADINVHGLHIRVLGQFLHTAVRNVFAVLVCLRQRGVSALNLTVR